MTIPASQIVQVNPGVLSAGGRALNLNGVILVYNTRVPFGTAPIFANQAAVAAYFGATSKEAAVAANYFLGFDNKQQTPGALYFMQYALNGPVGAYVRGTSVASLTLAQLQAIGGSLSVTIDGASKNTSALTLAGATSPSNAAQIIQTSLGISGPVDGVVTASVSTAGLMTVSAVTSGQISVGDEVTGTGIPAETFVTQIVTGTGGVGTYQLSANLGSAVTSETVTATLPAVTYDSILGAFTIKSATTGSTSTISAVTGTAAAALGFTGGVVSPGAPIDTPASAMARLAGITQNWAGFMPLFEPVLSDKEAFALWVSQSNNRFFGVIHDTDPNAIVSNNTTCFGAVCELNQYSGIMPISGNALAASAAGTTLLAMNQAIAAFVLGMVASIDFGQRNGRITLAFKTQAGLAPNVTDATSALVLEANGYNFYGAYATANQGFDFYGPGSITGEFDWADDYVNQIYLNSQLQLALMTLLTNAGSIPYNDDGYNLIKAACADPINQALNFGTIRSGVTLSALEAQELNDAAGLVISNTVQNVGYYLQVLDPGAQARGQRLTPDCTLFYTDGGSVQQISLASIDVM